MRPVLLCAMIALAGAAVHAEQTKGPIPNEGHEGFYKVTAKDSAAGSTYIYLSSGPSGQLIWKDLRTGQKLDGVKRADGSVAFPLRRDLGAHDMSGELVLSGWTTTGADGTLNTSEIIARRAVAVVKLVSVWECGNHESRHLAGSEQEMKEAEAKYACQGWHRVSPK
jgi:hypothetical protein